MVTNKIKKPCPYRRDRDSGQICGELQRSSEAANRRVFASRRPDRGADIQSPKRDSSGISINLICHGHNALLS